MYRYLAIWRELEKKGENVIRMVETIYKGSQSRVNTKWGKSERMDVEGTVHYCNGLYTEGC